MSDLSRIKQLDTIRSYLDYAQEKVTALNEFNEVIIFESTTYEDLFMLYPEKELPIALIVYTGSEYSNLPRRKAEISVFIIVSNRQDKQDAELTAIDLVDKVIDALDFETYNKVEFRALSDKAFDLDENGTAAYDIRFSVTDL